MSLSRVCEEIIILKTLNHPNIVKYVSGWYISDKKEVVIITEILPGGSLRQHLTMLKSPRLKLIKFWIKEILKGLNYLHMELNPPIIHRDIKCDNIFINKTNGSVKIGDLGRSEFLYHIFSTTYAGTEEFMAPEVREGKYTTKADIYSLGMCIIEMVTLDKPYKECEGAAMRIYESIKNGILPKSLKKIADQNLVKLIQNCLKRENERPTAHELLQNP
jgi:WNK lysine deficient protein kinase